MFVCCIFNFVFLTEWIAFLLFAVFVDHHYVFHWEVVLWSFSVGLHVAAKPEECQNKILTEVERVQQGPNEPKSTTEAAKHSAHWKPTQSIPSNPTAFQKSWKSKSEDSYFVRFWQKAPNAQHIDTGEKRIELFDRETTLSPLRNLKTHSEHSSQLT